MYYYEVLLGVARHWKTASFTYSSLEKIETGKLVRVPFGARKKIGIITSVVKKPSFKTKAVLAILDEKLPRNTQKFYSWYARYYEITEGEAISQVIPEYLTVKRKSVKKTEQITHPSQELKPLSPKQKELYSAVKANEKPVILHGITGSGKTRIYTHLIADVLTSGKDVLLLYPEIALTSQIVSEIRLNAPVFVFHSQLTHAERSALWYQIIGSHEPVVIIGPRSSLFLPYINLGLILIDEAHETTYKQDSHPRYHGLYVAAGLANAHSAKLVMGSATPPITETSHILERGGVLLCLHEKAIEHKQKTQLHVVDMKNRQQFKTHDLFSDTLLAQISAALEGKKQVLLFLNRRGTSQLVLCGSDTCDWVAECPGCELTLTYHHDKYLLICHTCGKRFPMPAQCPVCMQAISLKSLGSKAVVDMAKKLFPAATIARYDSDSDINESFNETYEQIKAGSVDILVGTQQLVKGLDLPKLAVIGLLNSDLSLRFPDFSSDERTFQLITQAMGRVGRGHTAGHIVLQTYQKQNPVLIAAMNEDWHGFMKSELEARKLHQLPPFSFIAKLIVRDLSEVKAIKIAQKFSDSLAGVKNLTVEGPVPSFHFKRGKYYYIQLHLKSSSRRILLEALKDAPDGTFFDLDPVSLL